ncbi:MAG: hypothetical protein SFY32_16735 [Bacteroidota bacterium]|nr:hypothetical protein [Bacteroidota bacterium]
MKDEIVEKQKKGKVLYDFKKLKISFSIPSLGSDWNPYNITEDIPQLFGDKVQFDKKFNYIFYPLYNNGEIGLLYYFDMKKNRSKSPTYYFGWGTINYEGKAEFYLFDEKELTTSFEQAEETMFKYILKKKYFE